MNVGWCSSPSEITTPCVEGLRCSNKNLLGGKPFDNIGHLTKKVDFLSFSSHSGKVPISAHLHPGHLEGSYVGKRQLQEATPKLDVVRTLLIDNYDSYTYNIYQELSVINGLPPVVIRNDAWTWDDVIYYLYEKKAFDNIVISPGPGSPACPDDIGICLRLLLECKDLPILGVCLGHQALGYVHGAHIVYADEPVHGRLSEIEHNGCKLFQDIPSGKNSGFEVVRYHSLVIESESLPKELVPIAWTTSAEAHSLLDIQSNIVADDCASRQRIKVANGSCSSKFGHKISWLSSHVEGLGPRKVLMGVKHLTRPHYGVQFHPESVATRYGRQIFDNFKQMTMDYWRRSRSPVLNGKKFYNTVQVPEASPLSREVPGSLEGTNNAAKDYHGMHNLVNNLHSRTHKPLKLRWRKIDSLVSQVDGARKIFSELFGGERAENTFWLDSSSTEKRRARFSFMGGKGGSLWKQLTYRLSDSGAVSTGGFLSVEDAQGSTESTFLEDGFLDYLNKELLSYHYESEDYKGLPFDFCGGYVGYIGYNLKAECGDISNQHRSGTPDACFFFADNLVVIDHYCDDVYILSLDDGTTTSWIENTEQKLLNLKSSGRKTFRNQASRGSILSSSNAGFIPDKSREQYKKDVENCLKFIRDGESYELCLTTQFRKAIAEIDMLGFYLHLREKNPSPYAAWLNFSKDSLCICCSSPERFLQLDRNGILEAKPIKGTVARGRTPEEDELLKMQLKHSEKDQAENLMIVDLLRNDLGRVCEPGSVHVPHLMEVESYATVHTMVSTIRGEKKTDISPVECVRAAFPGGSMTGAPKLRSMELLDSLESCSRGVYSGCIGYFSYNQTFDLNIVIRTVVIHKGEASIGAGGAIVALSNPENEYEEMMLKTRAPASAVLEYENWLPLDQ